MSRLLLFLARVSVPVVICVTMTWAPAAAQTTPDCGVLGAGATSGRSVHRSTTDVQRERF
jgi:hypothetical protein